MSFSIRNRLTLPISNLSRTGVRQRGCLLYVHGVRRERVCEGGGGGERTLAADAPL
jgi:hypothetical protein